MKTNPQKTDPGFFVSLEHPEALIEPEKIIRAYFNSPNIGLCILDSDLRYLAINRTLAEMNGLPVEAHLDKTVHQVLGSVGWPLENKFREVLETKRPLNFELAGEFPFRTGKAHWTAHIIPIRDNDDKVGRIAGIVLDITAQRNLEHSLEQVGGQLQKETGKLQMLRDVSELLSSNWDV